MKKFLFLLFLVSSSSLLKAQKIMPAVQQGHFNDVVQLFLDENEKFLTSIGTDGQEIRWDLKTGMQLSRKSGVPDADVLRDSESQSYSDTLVFNDTTYRVNGPLLEIYYQNKLLSSKTSQYFDLGFSKIITNAHTRYIFASSFDGKIYVFDKTKFNQKKILNQHQASVNDLIISADGRLIYSASSDRTIIEWNTHTLTMNRRFHGHSFRITSVCFDYTGDKVLLGNEIGELKTFDLTKYNSSLINTSLSSHPITSIVRYSRNQDSAYCIVTPENRIRLFHPENAQNTTFDRYHKISWKQSQQKIFEYGLGLYLSSSFENVLVDISNSENSYLIGGKEKKNRLRRKIIYKKKGAIRKTIRTDAAPVMDIKLINDTLAAVLKPAASFDLSVESDSELTIWKIKKRKLHKFSSPLTSVSDIEKYHERYLFILKGGSVIIWDLGKNTQQEIPLAYSGGAKNLWIKDRFCFISDFSNRIHAFNITDDVQLSYLGVMNGHEGAITGLDLSLKNRIIVTSSEDATVRFWSLNDFSLLNTLIPVGKTEFIQVAPSGEYLITKKAFRKFGFSTGDHFIYPDQLDLKYNQPQIVLSRLKTVDSLTLHLLEKAYLKRLQRMGFSKEKLSDETALPQLNVSSYQLKADSVTLSIEASDAKSNLNRINVFVNDVPVFGSRGYSLNQWATASWTGQLNIGLISGKNKIEVSVLNNNGVESLRQSMLLDVQLESQPDLYILSFGASIYKDTRYNLTYPHKDADDVQQLLHDNPKKLYGNVFSKVLTNENFTQSSMEQCRDFLKDAKRKDLVIIFVAGHGVLDKDLNYYLATHDMDFSNPSEKGLPYEELESLLDSIAPLKKVLFLDACHSGEVDKEEVEQLAQNTTSSGKVKFRNAGAGIQKKNLGLKTTSELMGELFTDLRRGTGATVISSAGGAEYAMESDEWKNGLFTYCLLHGLKDKKADANGDGQIMLSELQQYLRKEVTSLSNGAQQPTSRIENLSMDFRVW